jgi:hypothetical protein
MTGATAGARRFGTVPEEIRPCISAIAGWVQPSTGDLLDAALDTSGTFWGAVCFFAGAALLLRADTAPAPEATYASSAASMS